MNKLFAAIMTTMIIGTVVVVFVLGIKVLLKGLTWPGVVNSWFLGTVRSRRRAPFPSFSPRPSTPRRSPRERDDHSR